VVPSDYGWGVLSHFRAYDSETPYVSQDRHSKVTVRHTTVDLEVFQDRIRAKRHALEDGPRLKSVCLQHCAGQMAGIGVLRDTYF